MDDLALAHHEAGHLVAATMRGVVWDYATIVPVYDMAGHVSFRPAGAYLDLANRAFLYWAGPYAESRFTGRPLVEVINSPSASSDREVFGPFLTGAITRQWAEELDSVWPVVEQVAARLLLTPLLLPDAADPLQDASAVSSFVSAHHP